jgi:hypothetical protein
LQLDCPSHRVAPACPSPSRAVAPLLCPFPWNRATPSHSLSLRRPARSLTLDVSGSLSDPDDLDSISCSRTSRLCPSPPGLTSSSTSLALLPSRTPPNTPIPAQSRSMRARGAYPATTPTSDSYPKSIQVDTNTAHNRNNDNNLAVSPHLLPSGSPPLTSRDPLDQHDQRLANRKGQATSFSVSSSSAYSGRTGLFAARTHEAVRYGDAGSHDRDEFTNVPTGMMLVSCSFSRPDI